MWSRYKYFKDVWTTTKVFNGCTYAIFIDIRYNRKNIQMFISTTSGKKRKQMEAFEHQTVKSVGGIEALFWIKRTALDFPAYYKEHIMSPWNADAPLHLCIEWTDSRRRNIYERLQKEGFSFGKVDGCKALIKIIK